MNHDFDFRDVLAGPARAARPVEDVLTEGALLDFSRRFPAEALARTDSIAFSSDDGKRVPNPIRGHEHLKRLTPAPAGLFAAARDRTAAAAPALA